MAWMLALQVSQVTAPSDPAVSLGYAVGYVTGFVVVLVLLVHGSGKLMEKAGQSYWFGVGLGMMCSAMGLIIAFTFYLYDKYSDKVPAAAHAPRRYR